MFMLFNASWDLHRRYNQKPLGSALVAVGSSVGIGFRRRIIQWLQPVSGGCHIVF